MPRIGRRKRRNRKIGSLACRQLTSVHPKVTAALIVLLSTTATEPLDFPCAVGASWTYDIVVLDQRGTATQEVAYVRQVERGREVTLKMSASLGGKSVVGTETLLVANDAVSRVSGPSGRLDPPMPLMRWGADPAWSWEGSEGSETGWARGSAVALSDLVVPAGKFKALESSVDQFMAGRLSRADRYWFSNGVGWVRIESEMPGGTVKMTLRSYQPR